MGLSGSGDSTPKAPAPAPVPVSVPAPVPTSGFRARLEGLSLFDLVQMECLARSRRIVRVVSSGRVGYLYFRDGDIVHAGTKTLTGERAVLEILAWSDGVFEPCHIAWPERTTVTSPWQRLLLLAAKAKDEQGGAKLVRLPSRRSGADASEAEPDTTDAGPASATPVPEVPEVKVRPESAPPSVQQAVRIDPSGQVLSIVGGEGDFGGFTAYAARLAALIGESLGLERFVAMDLGFERSRCVLYVEGTGNLVAVKAKSEVDLGSVARRAGL